MTQMERIKPCVIVTEEWVQQLLITVQLEAMEIPLYKTYVTFTTKESNIIPPRK